VIRAGLALLALLTLAAACADDDDALDRLDALTGTPGGNPSVVPATPSATGDGSVTLVAGGDVMLGRSLGEGILSNGSGYPFEFIAQALAAADLAFVNLEVPVTDREAPVDKDFVFRAPPEAVEGIAAAGIDVVSLANNHAYDHGPDGLLDTIANVEGGSVKTVGAGHNVGEARAPLIVEAGGLRIAFLAYVNTPNDSGSGFDVSSTQATETSPGVNWLSPERVAEDVSAARPQADVVVVSMHTGYEYQEAVSDLQAQSAHAAIDAGAALVIGAHPHVLQGIETYNGGLILYSLGNFVFDFDYVDYLYEGLPSSLSAMVSIELTKDGVASCTISPVIVGEVDGRPRFVDGDEAAPVLERLRRLSDGSCGLGA
jgi:poly-gamma-glutamate synthesis protein (capsule biosynthesis protein)